MHLRFVDFILEADGSTTVVCVDEEGRFHEYRGVALDSIREVARTGDTTAIVEIKFNG